MSLHINGILYLVMAAEKKRKIHFTQTKIKVLVVEVEAKKNVSFGGHSISITNKRTFSLWKHVVTAVNDVSARGRSVPESKKKWSDLKVEAEEKTATGLLQMGARAHPSTHRWIQQ